ncbi:DNA repair protein Rad7, protein [Purpureocillium lavendulum]|uniref:DNA repair protein Rad7, protein n=1 Tax=Purpureocillium lavendulum TaxID=1247861 RepID=A0AB34FNR8_9HYPO|nr:DNA repair protein Rad7, protein [Purpureocillium lavendulum]
MSVATDQSALTDFLASHNISARQIRDDAEQRRQQAVTQAEQNGEEVIVAESSRSARRRASRADNQEEKSKKKAEEAKAIEKIKASKAFKKRKKHARDSDDDDELAQAIFESHHAPLPGQMENCEICSKRFTVTPYSLAGPNGGLLCSPCSKELDKEKQGQPKKKARKQTSGVGSRRAIASRLLDGDVGTKSLATLCVQTLAKNVDLADSLGDLPEHLVDKIARMFSKRRLLKSETLPLFAQPLTETLHIYDGAKLGERDFISIFQVATNLKRFKARAAIQFKDEVMDYLLSRNTTLESFYLHGANLLSEEKWHEFLAAKGQGLKGLQVYYTDRHFGDDSIVTIAKHCPNMQRLKVENNQKMTDKGVEAMGDLSSLQHLGLQLQNRTGPEAITGAISKIGGNLRTLSLKIVPDADDTVLHAIHEHCRSLTKLRITESEFMTDKGFADLFTGWTNPPLQFLDLQKCRHVDSARPRHNDDGVGLCSEGFKALMAHSGAKLENLNIHACRHISREAFEEAFSENARYPELKKLEISFCEDVTDFILGSIFRACPKIREVNVFGCMKVRDVRVPRGVILVGVPNAQGMVTEGTE